MPDTDGGGFDDDGDVGGFDDVSKAFGFLLNVQLGCD